MRVKIARRNISEAEIKNMRIAEEAVRLVQDDPELSVEQALEKSKKMLEEKYV